MLVSVLGHKSPQLDAYLTGNEPRLFEGDSTILKWRMSAILWNASCTDGALSGGENELIGELDGAGGIERITPSPTSNGYQRYATCCAAPAPGRVK